MQHRPVLIGVLAAELAVGLLAAAPPAAADEPEPSPADPALPHIPLPVRDGHTDVPLPDPLPDVSLPVKLPIRTGRAGDVHPDPAEPAPATPAPPEAPAPSAPDRPPPPPAAPAPTPTTAGAPAPAAPAAASAPPPSQTVAPGDSLWEIAARQLAIATGRDHAALGAPEIAGYWVRVCDANRLRLRSRDLDLIYAGEVVELPPV